MDKDYAENLNSAYKFHIAGDYIKAKDLYEKLININPDDADLLNLYAQLNVTLRNYDKAAEIFNTVYEKTGLDEILMWLSKTYFLKQDYTKAEETIKKMKVQTEAALNILSSCYMYKKDYKNAISCYMALLKISDRNYIYYYNLSLCCKLLNKLEDSLKYALKAYEINPNDVEIMIHAASLLENSGDIENAAALLVNVFNLNHNTGVLYKVAILYKKLKKYHNAVECFKELLKYMPDDKKIMLNLASVYSSIDKMEALKIYKKLNKIYPDNEEILFDICLIYQNMMDYKKALSYSLKLTKLFPDDFIYFSLSADIYMDLFNYKSAAKYYKKALKLAPEDEYSNCGLAYNYSLLNNMDKALEILNKLPKTEAVIQDITLLNLKSGNFRKVEKNYYLWLTRLKQYENTEKKARKLFYKLKVGDKYSITEDFFADFRKKITDNSIKYIKKYMKKLWDKEDVTDKTVLVYSAHGTGDVLFSLRYLKLLVKKAKKVIVSVPESLIRLIEYNFPEVEVVSQQKYIPYKQYDCATPFMCLIYNLDMDFTNIPYSKGYIKVSRKLIKEKSKLPIFNNNDIKIGLYWQGNPSILPNRSVKLKKLLTLCDIHDIKMYSFQISKIDFESHEILKKTYIEDVSSYIKNYEDTAALLKNIDILITIDTSIANLAGAMGVKTFLLLPYDPDWRWFFDTKTTPWYNSVRIFKQTIPNDWSEPISAIKTELLKIKNHEL